MTHSLTIRTIVVASLFTLGSFVCSLYLPVFIFIPVWVLVYVGITTHSYVQMLIVATLALIPLYILLGNGIALFFIVVEINLAILLYLCVLKQYPSTRIMISSLWYLGIVCAVFMFMFHRVKGISFPVFVYNELATYIRGVTHQTSTPTMYQQHSMPLLGIFKEYFVAITLIWCTISFALCYQLAYYYFRKVSIALKPFFVHALWRPHEAWVFGLIAAGGAYIGAIQQTPQNLLLVSISKNILVLFVGMYSIAGLMLFHYFSLRLKIPRPARMVLYVLMVIQPVMLLVLACLGLIDVWIHFRHHIKIKRIIVKRIN